jgi:hypothetical protein
MGAIGLILIGKKDVCCRENLMVQRITHYSFNFGEGVAGIRFWQSSPGGGDQNALSGLPATVCGGV